MGSDLVVYAPRPDATPEAELCALVSTYRFILDSAQKRAPAPAPPTTEPNPRGIPPMHPTKAYE
jgi:hypothetical protein